MSESLTIGGKSTTLEDEKEPLDLEDDNQELDEDDQDED